MSTVSITASLALVFALVAIRYRDYGWTLFIGVPFLVGFCSVSLLSFWGPRSRADCLRIAGATTFVLSLGFLVLGIEGAICIVLAAPLVIPLVLLGAWIAYRIHESSFVPPTAATLLVVVGLTFALWMEVTLLRISPTYTVSDAIEISASPRVVWDSLVTMGDLGQPRDLLFRMGVACPQRVDIYGSGVGAMRVCTLTTGQLHERITEWKPGRLLRWKSISTPPPMKELNPFAEVDAPHLHGFYRSVGGEFQLDELPSGHTLVVRSSAYQHGLFPAAYWRLWSDYVASRGHRHVLSILKQSAEASALANYVPDRLRFPRDAGLD